MIDSIRKQTVDPLIVSVYKTDANVHTHAFIPTSASLVTIANPQQFFRTLRSLRERYEKFFVPHSFLLTL